MTFKPFTNFIDRGEMFVRCSNCQRVGRSGWAHACRVNWYSSVDVLRATERRDRELIGKMVRASKLRGR